MKELYVDIFKRKSFHVFTGIEKLSNDDINDINEFIKNVKHLDDTKIAYRIVPTDETNCICGAEYCIVFYSEKTDNYLRNIGYIGEQVDLYLTSKNIGACWFGVGKPDVKQVEGLDYVIMIAIAKMSEDKFRKDSTKVQRKDVDEIWRGDRMNIAQVVGLAPSACNSQPWFVENNGDTLSVYRCKRMGPAKIPFDAMAYFNKIDIGIFMCVLEICLDHENYNISKVLFPDNVNNVEKVLVARYTYEPKNESI